MLKIIGASESYDVLTVFCDGEPSVQNVWCHTDEAPWLIVTTSLNSTCHVVATSRAFTLCWHGQTYTVLCWRWACSLVPSASQGLPGPPSAWWLPDRRWLVACGKGMEAQAACAWLCFHLLATWKQVQLWAGAAAWRTRLLTVLKHWQCMVQGQLQQIP